MATKVPRHSLSPNMHYTYLAASITLLASVNAAIFTKNSGVKMLDEAGFEQVMKKQVSKATLEGIRL